MSNKTETLSEVSSTQPIVSCNNNDDFEPRELPQWLGGALTMPLVTGLIPGGGVI